MQMHDAFHIFKTIDFYEFVSDVWIADCSSVLISELVFSSSFIAPWTFFSFFFYLSFLGVTTFSSSLFSF
jgi:hypothetical protein